MIMKKTLFLITLLIALCGCSPQLSQVKRIAQKGLHELGSGKYAGECFGRTYINLNISKLFDSPYFSRYGLYSDDAQEFIKHGNLDFKVSEEEDFFETDVLFDEIVFVDSYQYTMDVYRTSFFSRYHIDEDRLEAQQEVQQRMIDIHKDDPGFFCTGYDYCYLVQKDAPKYQLKYKLDNKYLATVYVVCVKGEKPTITAVFIK